MLIYKFYTGYLPDQDVDGKEKWIRGSEEVWKTGMRVLDKGSYESYIPGDAQITDGRCPIPSVDVESITKTFVNHVQTSLARQPYNIGEILFSLRCFAHADTFATIR